MALSQVLILRIICFAIIRKLDHKPVYSDSKQREYNQYVSGWDLRETITAFVEGDLFEADIWLQLRSGPSLQHTNLGSLNIKTRFISLHYKMV